MPLNMSRYFLAFFVLFGSLTVADADLLMLEDFEDNTVNYTGVTEFYDTANDHFTIVPLNGVAGHDDGMHTGFGGSYYFSAEDMNDAQGPGFDTQALVFNINITNYTDLVFSGLFAAGNNNGAVGQSPRYDGAPGTFANATDFVHVTAQIDGGVVQPIIGWAGVGENGQLRRDNDFDKVGDGSILGLAAASVINFPINGTGNNLALSIEISMDASGEEFAMDNIRVNGTAVPEPSGLLALSLVAVGLAAIRRIRSSILRKSH